MNTMDFAKLVRKMRLLQKQYFKTRSRQTLQECKLAEAEVDRAVQSLTTVMQTTIFNNGGAE